MKTSYFFKGLQTDMTTRVTPEGSYSFALNAAVESHDGSVYSITTEQGNTLSVTLENNQVVIGHVLTGTHKFILFSTDGTYSYISHYDPAAQTVETIIKSSCLGFQTSHPIYAIHTLRKGCEDVIYFTDNLNPYRVINLSSLQSYLPINISPQAANSSDLWSCGKFSLTRDYQIPTVELDEVRDSGGELKVGTVQFAIQYLDQDLNETNWIYVTNPVAITYGTNWDITTGPINIPVGAVDIPEGAVPPTTKSIKITINDLDPGFSFFRLAALHATGGAGTITEVYLLDTTPISQQGVEYVYAGPNLNNASLVSLSDIQIDSERINRVKTHAIAGNNLYLGNLSGPQRDFAALQRVANKTLVKYITKLAEPYNRSSEGDPKSPHTYFDSSTFMPDEIYAFAIEFIYSDGSVSPAFHIPGRHTSISANDQSQITDENQTEFLGGGAQPRWKLYSTSITVNATEGWMGYHESDSATYPAILDCDGNQVYDTDYWGFPLAGAPVRHHRTPSRATIPATKTVNGKFYIQPIGVKVENINYPSSEIVGHRILMAKRDEFNKTVLDNGFLSQVHLGQVDNEATTLYAVDGASSQGMFYSSDSSAVLFVSPKTLLKKENFGGSHISLNGSYVRSSESTEDDVDENNPYNAMGFLAPEINIHTRSHLYGESGQATASPKVVSYNEQVYVDPSSKQAQIGNLDHGVINTSFTTFYPIIQMNNRSMLDTFQDQRLYVAAVKKHRDVYSSLSNLVYIPLSHNLSVDDIYFNGGSFLTPLSWLSVTQYEFTVENPPIIIPFFNPFIGVQLAIWFFFNQRQNYYGEYISNVWVDSDVNFALRYGGQQECNKIYQGGVLSKYFLDKMFFEVTKDDVDDGTVKIKYKPRDFACYEYYAYNNDFSKLNTEKPSFPLPQTYDYCSTCFDSYLYRIRVSQKGYQEETRDNLRVFLPLDYADLDGSSGPLTALRTFNDNLFAISTKAAYIVPINPQTLQTNETTAFLGTGAALSIPPKKLISAPYSYGGSQQQQSVISSEFGVFSVDSLSGKVFLIGQGAQELSNAGMRNFFEDNLEIKMNESFLQSTSTMYPFIDSTTHPYGVGILSYYDPRHRRFVITKKDYIPLFEYGITPTIRDIPNNSRTRYWWDESQEKFVHSLRTNYAVPISFDDATLFENKSFTMSYHVPSQAWVSFHSYIPPYAFNDAQTFYTTFGPNVYEHYKEIDFLNFYDEYSQFILDYPSFAGGATSVFHSLVMGTEALQYHPDTKKFYLLNDTTFDKLWAYNSYQSTGLQSISVISNPFDITTESATQVPTKRVDSQWRINDLRDYVVDRQVPVESSDWADISADYYIDKVPNPDATSVLKSMFETERLRDQYISTRLFFNGRQHAKLRTDYIHTNFKPSYR